MREEERESGKKPFGAITAQALQFFIIESLIGKVFLGCHSKLLAQMSDNAESDRGGGRKTCKGGYRGRSNARRCCTIFWLSRVALREWIELYKGEGGGGKGLSILYRLGAWSIARRSAAA